MMKIREILDKREQQTLSEARTPSQQDIESHALDMAKKYNVPFDIIMRHMWVESRYKTKARSNVDAYGLMQLMPKTAKGLGVDRYDWKQNIEGGAKYLDLLRKRIPKRTQKTTGAPGVKDMWQAVAIAYYSGGGGFNKVVRAAHEAGYVDKEGKVDWLRFSKETGRFSRKVKYADAVHNPDHRIQKSRLRRHPSYTIPVPKEYIHSTGLESFGNAPTGTDNKTVPKDSSKTQPTIIYIGDSTTGGMSRHMKKIFKANGVDAHVFHVNGAGAALMHTMVTGRLNRWSNKYDKAKRDKAMAIAAKIEKLKSQGSVSIRISSLGGNDRFRVASKKGMDRYVDNYVKPLFKMVDEVGGSGRSKTYENDLKNKAVDEKYKAAAKEAGTSYYSARGADGSPQSFGSPWKASDDFPWRKKQGITAYYKRQAEERIKFSLIKKNLNTTVTNTPQKKFSFKQTQTPSGRFLRSYKSFLKKNPNFNFDKFYKDVETHLGSVSYAMPKHGSDYVFGPEHMKTWKALQKNKAKSKDTIPTSGPIQTPDGPVIGPTTKEKEQDLIDKTLAPAPAPKPATTIPKRSTSGTAGPDTTVSTDDIPPAKFIKKGYKSEDGDWVDGKWGPEWHPHY
jgi:hypothetical protein